jgi:hypothetical protein
LDTNLNIWGWCRIMNLNNNNNNNNNNNKLSIRKYNFIKYDHYEKYHIFKNITVRKKNKKSLKI